MMQSPPGPNEIWTLAQIGRWPGLFRLRFRELGFVLAPGLTPSLLPRLREASRSAAEAARADHPGKGGGRYIVALEAGPFADYLADDPVQIVVSTLFGDVVRWNYLHGLLGDFRRDVDMVWHRDGMDRYADARGEMALLARRQQLVQWNCPLYPDDDCFCFVPGTHRRLLTADELACLREAPSGPLDGEIRFRLEVGTALYYNPTLLHLGRYRQGLLRETLHGGCESVWSRWRPWSVGYGKEYLLAQGYLETLPPRLRPWLEQTRRFVREVKRGLVPRGDELGSLAYSAMIRGEAGSESS
ncbi:hypothetical protein SCOR_20190 [Sulfidibacter corallicola]|uniref:Uncharacterized protein n=1 Tax=Sulfidibacter corallicola TaxID=2818388 RepID=A0A8A4TVP2_SULCO|nr:hypothetical protein [Sulfidibacter corallicola]QTD53238.1 hypothetical protein J3U87_12345 [Sulfidibacter corallicola]